MLLNLTSDHVTISGPDAEARANAVRLLLVAARAAGFELVGSDPVGVTLAPAEGWLLGRHAGKDHEILFALLSREVAQRQAVALLFGADRWGPDLGPRLIVVFVQPDDGDQTAEFRSRLSALLIDGLAFGLTVVRVSGRDDDRVAFLACPVTRLLVAGNVGAQAQLLGCRGPLGSSESRPFRAFECSPARLGH